VLTATRCLKQLGKLTALESSFVTKVCWSYADASGMHPYRAMRVPGRDGSPNRPPIPRYAGSIKQLE